MSKNAYRPDYHAIYPGVEIPSKVLDALKKSDRKMEYMEHDLKIPCTVKDENGAVVALLSGKEDSLERLLEANKKFESDALSPEEHIETLVEISELHRCLGLLEADELALIEALYLNGLTEREYAKQIGCKQQNINKRKHRIIAKIKENLNFFLDPGC